jgi:predicted DNA-binding ribbon-helix-helix protein
MSAEEGLITPEMTLIEVLHQHRQTEAVFRRYEGEAQGCLLCHALFDTLAEAAAKYGLDLDRLLQDLEDSAAGVSAEP